MPTPTTDRLAFVNWALEQPEAAGITSARDLDSVMMTLAIRLMGERDNALHDLGVALEFQTALVAEAAETIADLKMKVAQLEERLHIRRLVSLN